MGEKQHRTKPWYLSIVAILLMLGGALNSFLAFGPTLEVFSSGRGSVGFLFMLVYMHILWWTLVLAGFGISQGFEWSRLVMSAALIGLFVSSLSQTRVTLNVVAVYFVYFVLYGAAIAVTFTPRASAFFKRRGAGQPEGSQPSEERPSAG